MKLTNHNDITFVLEHCLGQTTLTIVPGEGVEETYDDGSKRMHRANVARRFVAIRLRQLRRAHRVLVG